MSEPIGNLKSIAVVSLCAEYGVRAVRHMRHVPVRNPNYKITADTREVQRGSRADTPLVRRQP